MKLKVISVLIIILILLTTICGCKDAPVEYTDSPVINNGEVKIGVLTYSDSDTAPLIKSGIEYAHSLASSLKLDSDVSIKIADKSYTDKSSIESSVDGLVSSGVGAVICDGYNYEFSEYIAKLFSETKIPVIFLSDYFISTDSENIFSLAVNDKFSASCAATLAMENNFKKCAIILESDNSYYKNLAETYNYTLNSYISSQATVYYMNGEEANYTPDAVKGGNYDYIFIAVNNSVCFDTIIDLRSKGVTSKILISEVLDKKAISNESFNNCSFINKLQADSNNNIVTVFLNNYSKYKSVSENEITSAEAYGYDAYMLIFESLKTFANNNPSSIFSNTPTTESTKNTSTEITVSQLTNAINNIYIQGVTDFISFENNKVVPTYIYVDNITNSVATLGNKYIFNATSTSN